MTFLSKTISEITKARTIARLARHCQAGLSKTGVNHVTYGVVKPGMPFSQAIVSSTYPKEWQERYIERSYASLDPVFVSCRHSVLPVNWLQVRAPSVESGQILQEAIDYGVGRTGLSIPVRGPDGTFAIASFSSEDLYQHIFQDVKFQAALVLISFHLHAQASMILGFSEFKSALTPRETEIVALIGSGKTVKEVGQILNLSISTIRFHLDNCRNKLGAGTIRGAVVKAVSMGLVRAGEKL